MRTLKASCCAFEMKRQCHCVGYSVSDNAALTQHGDYRKLNQNPVNNYTFLFIYFRHSCSPNQTPNKTCLSYIFNLKYNASDLYQRHHSFIQVKKMTVLPQRRFPIVFFFFLLLHI